MLIRRAFLALAIIATLSGCAAASTVAPTILSQSDEQAERSVEVARLHWPHDAAPTSFVEYPPAAVFEAGVGENQADTVWFCAWSTEWLAELSKDTSAASDALLQLETVETLPLWRNMDARGQQAMSATLAKARQGDANAMESQREALGCSS
jgi:hypothetical protein